MATGLIGTANDIMKSVVGLAPNPNGYKLQDALIQGKAGNVGTPQPDAPAPRPLTGTTGIIGTTTPPSVAAAPVPVTPQPRQITEPETVAGQLNTLLAKGNPYIESARNRGLELANSRGLINSSITAGTSERAAIDAALPIATQDATVSANAGQSAQQAGQDISLTGYKSLLDSAQQLENFGYRTKENEQNIAANIALQNDRIALDMKRLDADSRKSMTDAASPIIQQVQSEISQIQRTPNEVMSQEDKAAAIDYQNAVLKSKLDLLGSLYGYKLNWDTAGTTAAAGGNPGSSGAPTATTGAPPAPQPAPPGQTQWYDNSGTPHSGPVPAGWTKVGSGFGAETYAPPDRAGAT
jgi:hypothetical protein